MRKFTFILSLLLTLFGAGTASAQLTVSPTPNADGTYVEGTTWYTLKIGNAGYVSVADGYVDGLSLRVSNSTAPTDLKGYWCVTGDENNGYQLHNAAMPSTMVLGTTGSEANARSAMYYADGTDEGVTKSFSYVENTSSSGGYAFKLKDSDNNYLNNRGSYLALWNSSWSTSDGGSALVFEPVADVVPEMQLLRATFNYNSTNTADSWTEVGYKANGSTFVPELSYYHTDVTIAESDHALSPTNHTFNVSFTYETAPVQFSTTDSKTWYVAQFRGSDSNFMLRDTDNRLVSGGWSAPSSTFTEADVESFDDFNDGLWAFVESKGGVKILNKASQKYLTATVAANSRASLTESGTVFLVKTNSDNCNDGSGFSLLIAGSNNAYVGDHETYGNGTVGVWIHDNAQNDAGSCWKAIAVDGNERFMAVGKAAFAKNYQESDYVGGPTADGPIEAAAYVAGFTTISQLDAALTEFVPSKKTFDPTKTYRIIFKRGGTMAHMYIDGGWNTANYVAPYADALGNVTEDSQRYAVTRPDATDLQTLWKFEAAETEGQYYIRNVNSNLVLGTTNGAQYLMLLGASTSLDNAGLYSIVSSGTADSREYALRDHRITGENCYINCYYNPNAGASTNDEKRITKWKDANDSGNILYIQEVSEVPVTISAAEYSTLNLPFAVTIPAGVTASYVTGTAGTNGDELVLQDLSGVIPANTPVILQGAADTYNFAITTSSAEAPAGNLLTGTTLERHGMEAETYYGLGNKDAGVAFYLASSTEAPANKAILFAADLNGVAGVQALRFGGSTTGVESVPTVPTEKSAIYYDLSGRRVAYPSNGIFIDGNGRKVFIK